MTKRKPATVRHTITNPYGRRGQINEVDPNNDEVSRYLDSGIIVRVTEDEAEAQNSPNYVAPVAVSASAADSEVTTPPEPESPAGDRTDD